MLQVASVSLVVNATEASLVVSVSTITYTPNPRAARFNRPKVKCCACGFTYPRDLKWPELCEQCGQKIRKVDNWSVSRQGIRGDMFLSDIPLESRSKSAPSLYDEDLAERMKLRPLKN